MKVIAITAYQRPTLGKQAARQLRRASYIPGVLYGTPGDNIYFYAPLSDLHAASYTTCFVDLMLNNKVYRCIIKDKQLDPITDLVKHVDCYAIADDKPIVMEIPVTCTGNAPGVIKGGLLVKKLYTLTTKALPQHIPDKIAVDVSGLELGKTIKVKEIRTTGYTILNNGANPVAIVEVPRALRSKGGEAATEPTKVVKKPAAAPAEKKS